MGDWMSLADPTQQDILRAQVQALRQRNNPQDITRQSQAAALMGAFHDPGVQNMGKMLGSDAAARESETGPRLMEAMKSIQQGPQAALGGQTPENYRLRLEGPQADLGGMTPGNAKAKATLMDAIAKTKMAEQNWTHLVNPDTGEAWQINSRTGEARRLGGGGAGGGGGPPTADGPESVGKLGQKWIDSLKTDLDPNAFRAGVLKGNQDRSNAAERLLKLAVDPLTGGPANLNPQQMTELSTSLATLLAPSGSSEGQRHELTPYTKGRKFADVMQWLTDKPQGAEQQAFVQQMIDTAKREQGVVTDQIRKAQVSRLPAHLQVMQRYPKNAQAILEGYGFKNGEVDFKTGKYTPAAAAPPAPGAGAGAGPATIKSDAEFDALPSGAEFVGPDGKHRRKP